MFFPFQRMILVLLHMFKDSPDSLTGFLLCKKLVQLGHHLMVVTDAGEDEAEEEIKTATVMTKKYVGRVKVLQPGHLSELDNIDTMIAMVPRMIDDAVKFKATWKARLILVADAKITCGEENFRWLTEHACELWSIGPHLYYYHQQILNENQTNLPHKSVSLLPDVEFLLERQFLKDNIVKVVSFWHESTHYTVNGKRQQLTGSVFKDFDVVRSAIDRFNERHSRLKIQWFVYGLPDVAGDFQADSSTDSLQVVYQKTPNSFKDMLENCSLFIVPDVHEDHTDIIALSAMLAQNPHCGTKQIKHWETSVFLAKAIFGILNNNLNS